MSAAVNKEIQLEIAHVLFIDIVGYSKLLITEQSELLRNLTALVRGTEQFRSADTKGKLVSIATGDGMALAFFDNPEAPVECAMEISSAVKIYPDIRLRMGIHSGPVNQIVDINERSNIDDLVDWPAVNPHPQPNVRINLNRGANLHGAFDRRLRIVEKRKRHAVAGSNADELAFRVRAPELLGPAHERS